MTTIDATGVAPAPLIAMGHYQSMSDALGDAFQTIIADFFRDCGGFAIRLEEYSGEGRIGELRELCHEIKGAAALLGFRGLADFAAAWETAAGIGKLPDNARIPESFRRLVTETKLLFDSIC
jgi:HPt (histidine-containing phosphotransfer) domain-containing protein